MVKTYESTFPPSPNLDKSIVSFDKLNNTDLSLQIYGVYIVCTIIKGIHKINWPNQICDKIGTPCFDSLAIRHSS